MTNRHLVYQINVHYVISTVNIIAVIVDAVDLSVGKTDGILSPYVYALQMISYTTTKINKLYIVWE